MFLDNKFYFFSTLRKIRVEGFVNQLLKYSSLKLLKCHLKLAADDVWIFVPFCEMNYNMIFAKLIWQTNDSREISSYLA